MPIHTEPLCSQSVAILVHRSSGPVVREIHVDENSPRHYATQATISGLTYAVAITRVYL